MAAALSRAACAVVVSVVAANAWAVPPKRPQVDLQAMREAMASSEPIRPEYPSAASYAHFMLARLKHHDGEHRGAMDELRLALASDDENPYLMTQLAEQYARTLELERAEAQLKRVIEKNPEYPPAHLLMGRVLFEAQKTTRARGFLHRAIRLRPQQPDAYLVLTQLWLDQGRFDDAIKVVEEMGTAIPGDPVGYRRLGLALAERSDAVRAEPLLLKAAERDPGDVDVWVALARIHENAQRPQKALDAYDRALLREPEHREVLLSAGRLALREQGVRGARPYFDQLLSLGRDPEIVVRVAFSYLAANQADAAAEVLDDARKRLEEPRLHFYAGLVFERLRRWARAVDAFDGVPSNLGEVSDEARLHRASCLSLLGKHVASLDGFAKLLTDRPDLSGVHAAYGRALERAGKQKDAEAVLLRGFRARGAAPELVDAISGFHERAGTLPEAVKLFTQALAASPQDETLIFALAFVLERSGDWQRAVDLVKAILVHSPTNAAALNFVGYTLTERGGDLEQAEKLLKKALELKPSSAAYLDSLGWLYFHKKDFARAVELLGRAVEESPDQVTLLEHLAEAQRAAGQLDVAKASLQRALELIKEQPDLADRKGQRAELERKLKMLGI